MNAKREMPLLWASSFLVLGVLCLWLLFFSPGASARLALTKTETHVEIDGVNYGFINKIDNLSDLTPEQGKGESFTRVSLKRDFVTEPSLYLWAQTNLQNRNHLNHITVITESKQGLKRYELKNCKPLNGTFETADPSQGGFHEKIELAVQEIAVF